MEPKVLDHHSQSHVLRGILEDAGVRHGDDVRADLELDVMDPDGNGPTVFFCDMRDNPDLVRIRHVSSRGDGRELPPNVEIRGFHVPPDLNFGSYRLENFRVRPNSLILIERDRGSRVVVLEEERSGREQLATAGT